MKMKTRFIIIAAAVLGLAACTEKEPVAVPCDCLTESGEEYRVVLEGIGQTTKSGITEVSLELADLKPGANSSQNLIATLMRKTSSGEWEKVLDADYSWELPSQNYFSGSPSRDNCTLSAIAEGSSKYLSVDGLVSDRVVATSQDIEVIVSDDRSLWWSDVSSSLTYGTVETAVLNSNFTCTATIGSDNSDFLVGTSASSLSSTATVSFGSVTSRTIYYKYIGSSSTSITMTAGNDVASDDAILDAESRYVIDIELQGPSSIGYMEMGEFQVLATFSDGSTGYLPLDDPGLDVYADEDHGSTACGATGWDDTTFYIYNDDESPYTHGQVFHIHAYYGSLSDSAECKLKYVIKSVTVEGVAEWRVQDGPGEGTDYFADTFTPGGYHWIPVDFIRYAPSFSRYDVLLNYYVSYELEYGGGEGTITCFDALDDGEGINEYTSFYEEWKTIHLFEFDKYGFTATVFLGTI